MTTRRVPKEQLALPLEDLGEEKCPSCNDTLLMVVDFNTLGDEVTCPHCNQTIQIEMDYACDTECGYSPYFYLEVYRT